MSDSVTGAMLTNVKSGEFCSLPLQMMEPDSAREPLSLAFQVSGGVGGGGGGAGSSSTSASLQPQHSSTEAELHEFWKRQRDDIEALGRDDIRANSLPLARIKRIMKSDEDVRMISAEAPVLFSKACEIFILELTLRAWSHAENNKRRTVQRSDIAAAISSTDIFDFLVDIVPREGYEHPTDSTMMDASPTDDPNSILHLQGCANQISSLVVQPNVGYNVSALEPHVLSALFPRYRPQPQQQQQQSMGTAPSTNPTSALSDCTSESGNCVHEDVGGRSSSCQK